MRKWTDVGVCPCEFKITVLRSVETKTIDGMKVTFEGMREGFSNNLDDVKHSQGRIEDGQARIEDRFNAFLALFQGGEPT